MDMTANELTRKLDVVIKKHENDRISPFDTDFVSILKYLQKYILDQNNEIQRLNGQINALVNKDKEDKKRDVDMSFGDALGMGYGIDPAIKAGIGTLVNAMCEMEA